MLLTVAGAAFAAGLFIGSYAALPLAATIAPAALAFVLAVALRRRRRAVLACLAIATLFGGMARFHSEGDFEAPLAMYHSQGAVTLRGVAAGDPEVRAGTVRFPLAVWEVAQDGGWLQEHGTVQVRASLDRLSVPGRHPPSLHYGDLLELRGGLEAPPRLQDFDYQSYLARRGIGSVMDFPSVTFIRSGHGSWWREPIAGLRRALAQRLAEALPEPQAALAQGLVLGIRTGIPRDLLDDFSETGTTHLLAISGLNISILAGIMAAFFAWLLGRRTPFYLALTLLGVWLYSLLSGFDPPVVRAAIMGSLVLWGAYLGRQNSSGVALGVSAAVMAGLEPQLLWDVSFQLSFVAMLSLAYLAPPLSRLCEERLPQPWRETPLVMPTLQAGAVTVAAIIATAPLIAFNFQRISLSGLPATLLGMPVMPAIMVSGLATAVGGLVWTPLGNAIGWTAWLFLSYLEWVVRAFAALPAAAVSVARFNAIFVWMYYALLVITLWLWNRWTTMDVAAHRIEGGMARLLGKRGYAWASGGLAIAAALVWGAALAPSDNRLLVTVFAIGDGSAVLVRTPDHRTVLIDGGPEEQRLEQAIGGMLPFWDRTVDVVIAASPDNAHLAGLAGVTRRHDVGQAVSAAWGTPSLPDLQWRQVLREKRVPLLVVEQEHAIQLGKTGLLVQRLDTPQGRSNLAVGVQYGAVSILITSSPAQADASQPPTVLVLRTRGSSESLVDSARRRVQPQFTIATTGKEGWHSDNDPALGLLTVADGGSVEVISDGQRLWLEAHPAP